ncbi:MAG: aminotransferase class III-fold pyridoxal phosphate-dependent enzyme [Lentisphaeria bacterium]|nr:aminotransferase class III-fold pyridoxal phosphate-dependent enzyme [Lentisphaeria bacterium]
MSITGIRRSLTDIAGEKYISAVCGASAALGLGAFEELKKIACEKVDFYPEEFAARAEELALRSSEKICEGLSESFPGAPTNAFAKAFHRESAPLSGLGCVRVGEDGRIAFIGKSEHYQASLGHNFPGYKLLRNAERIGITNLTHNNTRGYLTRLLEREIVRAANGIAPHDDAALEQVLASREKHVLNRVVNLETGSLACEAAFKMALARFYRLQADFPPPPYQGRIPVFVVMADSAGGKTANYHGTTVLTQMMRGLWPEAAKLLVNSGLLRIVPCAINDVDFFRKIVEEYDSGKYKIALFTHELVLMNYAGIRLENSFVAETHRICDERDIPVFVDEIQSCMWSPEMFLFREYKCHPDFVSVGKGFPGGQYPASKILTTFPMDNLNQFGALVTNGQEELASLANLITMEFVRANAENLRASGKLWRKKLLEAVAPFSGLVEKAEGDQYLTSLIFFDRDKANTFSHILSGEYGIDVSVQTYKPDCPKGALLKLPLLATEKMMDHVLEKISSALSKVQ